MFYRTSAVEYLLGGGSGMRSRYCRIVAIAFASLASGCSGVPTEPDVNADSFVFFSIDGRDIQPSKEVTSSETFRGYPVMGKMDVKDRKTRESILTAFREGAPGKHTPMAACFWPRHAISTVRNGTATDYIICFECSQYKTISGDNEVTRPITNAPLARFNDILAHAGVKLAPPALESSE